MKIPKIFSPAARTIPKKRFRICIVIANCFICPAGPKNWAFSEAPQAKIFNKNTPSNNNTPPLIMVHDLNKGGHLSAQVAGALKNYVDLDPRTHHPAVEHFPFQKENPYRIDVLIPSLIVLIQFGEDLRYIMVKYDQA